MRYRSRLLINKFNARGTGHELERRFSKLVEITLSKSHYAVQGNSRSPSQSTSQRAVMPCSWGVKAGIVRVWVAGKTVWSPCYTRAISERFRDKELIIKRYINSPSLLYFYFYFTDFSTNRKLIYDFVLVINTNLPSISCTVSNLRSNFR